ncbi:MAG TPA: hypothetical protein VGC32_19740 [Solirubrobacterales bacterium]
MAAKVELTLDVDNAEALAEALSGVTINSSDAVALILEAALYETAKELEVDITGITGDSWAGGDHHYAHEVERHGKQAAELAGHLAGLLRGDESRLVPAGATP